MPTLPANQQQPPMLVPAADLIGKGWRGLNRRTNKADLDPSQSPDLSNCGLFRGIAGLLGPRPGRTFASQDYPGRVVGLIPLILPEGNGSHWLVAYDDASHVYIEDDQAPWQQWGGAGGGGGSLPGQAACGAVVGGAVDIEYDYSPTSGAFAALWITPYGTFTLNTGEVDSGAVKTSKLGCLTFRYPGASRGTRGVMTIKGAMTLGQYIYTLTTTGAATETSTIPILGAVYYTSAGEGYNHTLLGFGTTVHGLKLANSPILLEAS